MFLNRTAAWLTWNIAGGRDDINEVVDMVRRQGSLEKTIVLGKMRHRRKREKLNLRWVDSMKEAIGMSYRSWAESCWTRALWTSLICRIAKNWTRLNMWAHVCVRACVCTHTNDREKVDIQLILILWEIIIFSSSDIWTIFK